MFITVLHNDLWQSRQSGISWTGCSSCVNKVIIRKQAMCGCKQLMWVDSCQRLTTGMHGHQEVIYTQVHMVSHRVTASKCPEGAGAKWPPGVPQPRSIKCAKWDHEYRINVGKKIWVNIAVLRLSLSLSHTYTSFNPYKRNKEIVIFL